MKRIIILHGTPGVSLTRCAIKIKSSLSSLVSVEHEDLEEQIKTEYSFQSMRDAVWPVPREVIRWSIWPKAAHDSISRLLSSSADIGLLTCHLTYYRGQTHEFYEPGDLMQVYAAEWSKQPTAPTTAPPLLLVTLIDDVYDTFARLSAQGEVFDIQSAISDEYRRREEKREEPTEADSQYVLAQQQVITTMLRILDWRSREISAGDSLAIRAEGRSFVVAIKHPTQVVRDLILSECGITSTRFRPVYLSHPITRLRKDQKGPPARDWPDFVSQFHNFVRIATDAELDDGKLLLFMPTAIDEFRITDRQDRTFPSLHRRWPLISEDYNGLLYEIPSSYRTYDEFENRVLLEAIFNPVGSARSVDANRREVLTRYAQNVSQVGTRLSVEKKPEVSALFDILRQQISAQIAFRGPHARAAMRAIPAVSAALQRRNN